MITYIAIYAGIGLVVGVGVLLHQYYFLNESITVKDIIRSIGFCLIAWPPVAWCAVLEFTPEIIDQIEKLMNKVVIKKRK